jgi:hypothetical protein
VQLPENTRRRTRADIEWSKTCKDSLVRSYGPCYFGDGKRVLMFWVYNTEQVVSQRFPARSEYDRLGGQQYADYFLSEPAAVAGDANREGGNAP